MATAFSENEKTIIRLKLHQAAEECLGKYGVKRTTVDQLAKMAGISKGAFYSFYPSKETLFFVVYEEYQKSIMEEVVSKLSEIDNISSQEFADLMFSLYYEFKQSFIMNIVQSHELEYLMRKLPPDVISNHHSVDDLFAEAIFAHIKLKENISLKVVTAALRAIFMSMLHEREIGESEYDDALRLLIAGLMQKIMED